MFIEAIIIAIKLNKATKEKVLVEPRAIMAPTSITPEIALVTDISGVCKAGVTFHTTKYPTKQDNINKLNPNIKGLTPEL